jgi:hypothetical protein
VNSVRLFFHGCRRRVYRGKPGVKGREASANGHGSRSENPNQPTDQKSRLHASIPVKNTCSVAQRCTEKLRSDSFYPRNEPLEIPMHFLNL